MSVPFRLVNGGDLWTDGNWPPFCPVRWRKEPIIEPELPILDPHHHLCPGWRYLLEDLLLDTGSGHNIVATVYMEARSMYREQGAEEMRPVGETEFANGMAAMCSSGVFGKTRACAGIVGHADLTLGSRVEPVLSALMHAGSERFLGIRHGVSWDADPSIVSPALPVRPGLLADKKFREGVEVLSRLGLSYDVSLYHPQMPRTGRPGERVSRFENRRQPRRRCPSGSAPIGASAMK